MKQIFTTLFLLSISLFYLGCSYSSSSHIITQSVGYLEKKGDLNGTVNFDMSRTDLGINLNANYAITDRLGLNIGTSVFGSEMHPVNFERDNGKYIYSSEDFELKGVAIQASVYEYKKLGRKGYLQYGVGLIQGFNQYTDKYTLRTYTQYRYLPFSGLGNVSIGLITKYVRVSIGLKMMNTWYGEEVPVMTKLDYSFRRREDQLFSLQPYYDLRIGKGKLRGMIQSGNEFYPFKGYGPWKFNIYIAMGLEYKFSQKSNLPVQKTIEL